MMNGFLSWDGGKEYAEMVFADDWIYSHKDIENGADLSWFIEQARKEHAKHLHELAYCDAFNAGGPDEPGADPWRDKLLAWLDEMIDVGEGNKDLALKRGRFPEADCQAFLIGAFYKVRRHVEGLKYGPREKEG